LNENIVFLISGSKWFLYFLSRYQFNPGYYQTNVTAQILMKALTNLPHTDFTLCKCLIDTVRVSFIYCLPWYYSKWQNVFYTFCLQYLIYRASIYSGSLEVIYSLILACDFQNIILFLLYLYNESSNIRVFTLWKPSCQIWHQCTS
jgi:hypothetical protein